MTTAVRTTRPTPSAGWVPFALLALVLIPTIAGTMRLVELFGGPRLLPPNVRLETSSRARAYPNET